MKVGAVIVLFNPDFQGLYSLVDSLSSQVDVLCIIDNSAIPTEFSSKYQNIFYSHHPQNIGIAAAQNIGLRYLMAMGYRYGLLFDQDSFVDNHFISNLKSEFIEVRRLDPLVVAIGPQIICSFSDKAIKPLIQRTTRRLGSVDCVSQIISSGMLLDLNCVEQVGLKDESLFIDGVDHEWCWRAANLGLSVCLANRVQMIHSLGDSRGRFLFLTYKVGSPIRLYYQFRNVLLLIRRGHVPKYWKLRNVSFLPLKILINSCLVDNRRVRFRYMMLGLWDGLKGKTGAYHNHH